MYWIDELLKTRKGKERINDSWTPSGIIHMGSLKGPIIHDVLYRELQRLGRDVTFTYGFDDADPIDGLPPELRESHSQYLGVPIYLAPSPDGNGTFGDYYGNKMKQLLDELGIKPELYKTSELYKSGKFNKAIVHVLDNVEKVRQVYSEINKKPMASTWYPLQVLCPTCHKLGTTKVTGWDGKEVTFSCEKALVTWAEGCGTTGKMSPLHGNAKMPWKVEWAAKWWTWGVTIEGAGKDHGSAGGSYDVARKICHDVFGTEPPLKIVYEFFLAGGKKMSSSKGIGLNGQELLGILSPEVARFLMIYKEPQVAVEFSPWNSYVIPTLYDEYQRSEKAYRTQELSDPKNEERKRAFVLAQIDDVQTTPALSFAKIATLIQMPNLKQELQKHHTAAWEKFARVWIDTYAPEADKLTIVATLPEAVYQLSDAQKKYLAKVAGEITDAMDPDELQTQLYQWAKDFNLSSKDAFAAVYAALLNKTYGPKAAWLILDNTPAFIKERFMQAATASAQPEGTREVSFSRLNKPEVFTIDKKVLQTYPTISVGVATIKGVSIQKTDTKLEAEKEQLVKELAGLTTEQLGQFPEIIAYRQLYKSMGVDWHSRRPSPEALLRRIALNKGLYTVNTCVDAYNLVVMRNRVSVGAFDMDSMQFPTILRFPQPEETILLLGDEQPTVYKPAELAYFDQGGGFNIDFNYRDSQRTAVKESTKNLYINVDGIEGITPEQIEKVLKQTCDSIITYCGGTIDVYGVETS